MLGGHEAGVRIDIREQYLGAAKPCRVGCCKEGVCRNDNGIARADLRRQCGEMKGGGTAAAGHGVAHAQMCGECRLELLDYRTLREPTAAQHFDDSRDIVVVDRVAPIGQNAVACRGFFDDTILPCYRTPGERECTRAEGLFAVRLSSEPPVESGESCLSRSCREHVCVRLTQVN